MALFPYYNMDNNVINTPDPRYYNAQDMRYIDNDDNQPDIDRFMRDFNAATRPRFNDALFERSNEAIVEGIKKVILSCRRDKYFILDVLEFEVITDYDKIQDTLREYYSGKNKDKNQNPYEFINLRDSDVMLLKTTYYVKLNIPKDKIGVDSRTKKPKRSEGKFQSLIILPIYVDKYYFRIGGNYYSPMYQIVDGSTYNNVTSANSKNSKVTQKTQFMPINIYREMYELVNLGDNAVYPCTLYASYIFKKKIDAMKFILGRYGIYGATELLGIEQIYITKIPENFTEKQLHNNPPLDPNIYYNFIMKSAKGAVSSKMIVSVPKLLYDRDRVTQSFCYTLLKNVKKFNEFEDIYDPRYWTILLGGEFSSLTLDKGIPVLDSFESIYDIRTRETINLPPEDKTDTYHIVMWLVREFSSLRKKDNLDISTKILRMADEYLPYIYAAKLSTGIYRISDKGATVSFNDIIRVINTDPAYLIKNMNSSNLVPYVDHVNDNDAEIALACTVKGISGIGEQGGKSAVPVVYRHVHPSHLGRLDLDASSSSDPGLSGMVVPTLETYNGHFALYDEPNGWKDHYSNILSQSNQDTGIRNALECDKTFPLSWDYVKDDMVQETIAERKSYRNAIIDVNGVIDYGGLGVVVGDDVEEVVYKYNGN